MRKSTRERGRENQRVRESGPFPFLTFTPSPSFSIASHFFTCRSLQGEVVEIFPCKMGPPYMTLLPQQYSSAASTYTRAKLFAGHFKPNNAVFSCGCFCCVGCSYPLRLSAAKQKLPPYCGKCGALTTGSGVDGKKKIQFQPIAVLFYSVSRLWRYTV